MKKQAVADPKRMAIAAFADLAVKGGFVSFEKLRTYLEQRSVKVPLLSMISDLRFEGLIEPAYDEEYGEGIRLTAKGAVRLWFWCWPQEQPLILRHK